MRYDGSWSPGGVLAFRWRGLVPSPSGGRRELGHNGGWQTPEEGMWDEEGFPAPWHLFSQRPRGRVREKGEEMV